MTERVVVLADDRTGALETAGALARAGSSVPVEVSGFPSSRWWSALRMVVDMGSRHLPASEAAARAGQLAESDSLRSARLVLKMDSTLRGNWAAEAGAIASARRSPTVVVASFPAAGRTCVGGEVLERGRPVAQGPAGGDPRRPVVTSRLADLLVAGGDHEVAHCADAGELERWLADAGSGFAVCDASTDHDLDALGRVWARSERALFVGTAASIAAAVAARDPAPVRRADRPVPERPVLVCIGSLHPAARSQAAALDDAGWSVEVVGTGASVSDRHVVITSPTPDGLGDEAAAAVARLTGLRLSERDWRTLVVVGGDTAAAVLGPHPMIVGGLLGPGIPWGRLGDDGPLVVTKPGGFGGPDAIVRLFDETA